MMMMMLMMISQIMRIVSQMRTASELSVFAQQLTHQTVFLKHMDNDLKLICKSASIRKHDLDEVARTLTVNCINPLKVRKQQEKTLGTACGIEWKGIIVTVFIIGIILPGIIAFWYLHVRQKLKDR